jgi:hypothetical protein
MVKMVKRNYKVIESTYFFQPPNIELGGIRCIEVLITNMKVTRDLLNANLLKEI